jgi:secreted trypsin-like serine protease
VAVEGAWPWQVSLIYADRFTCGGSILNENWILTAAHCAVIFRTKRLLIVRAGSVYVSKNNETAKFYEVDKIVVHPWYDEFGDAEEAGDIALLHLKTPIVYTNTIRPICFAASDVNIRKFKVCVATGFGDTSYGGDLADRLLQGRMNPLSEADCRANFALTGSGYLAKVENDFYNYSICAGNFPFQNGISTCHGDSGGPLACKDVHDTWTVTGVTSWGLGRCVTSVFTRVSAFASWIEDSMDEN